MSPFEAELPEARRRRRRPLLSAVWLVPVMAAGAVGYLVHREVAAKGPEIEIGFRQADGIEANKTDLRYRGVKVGEVSALTLTRDLKRVVVHVELMNSAAPIAREGSQFWIVRPKISPTGISGIGTIITGAYIEASPGKGEKADTFEGLEQPPAVEPGAGGLELSLTAARLPGLDAGSAVLYRGVRVGSVAESKLSADARQTIMRVVIDKPYRNLVRAGTKFWNAGGVDFKFSLLHGAEIKAKSLGTLVEGGIAFATPDPPGEPAKPGQTFPLEDKPKDEWLGWSPKLDLK